MIEPTESESKAELDRFIAALKQIKQEVLKVERGEWPKEDNPLVNAPHTASDVTGEWTIRILAKKLSSRCRLSANTNSGRA